MGGRFSRQKHWCETPRLSKAGSGDKLVAAAAVFVAADLPLLALTTAAAHLLRSRLEAKAVITANEITEALQEAVTASADVTRPAATPADSSASTAIAQRWDNLLASGAHTGATYAIPPFPGEEDIIPQDRLSDDTPRPVTTEPLNVKGDTLALRAEGGEEQPGEGAGSPPPVLEDAPVGAAPRSSDEFHESYEDLESSRLSAYDAGYESGDSTCAADTQQLPAGPACSGGPPRRSDSEDSITSPYTEQEAGADAGSKEEDEGEAGAGTWYTPPTSGASTPVTATPASQRGIELGEDLLASLQGAAGWRGDEDGEDGHRHKRQMTAKREYGAPETSTPVEPEAAEDGGASSPVYGVVVDGEESANAAKSGTVGSVEDASGGGQSESPELVFRPGLNPVAKVTPKTRGMQRARVFGFGKAEKA